MTRGSPRSASRCRSDRMDAACGSSFGFSSTSGHLRSEGTVCLAAVISAAGTVGRALRGRAGSAGTSAACSTRGGRETTSACEAPRVGPGRRAHQHRLAATTRGGSTAGTAASTARSDGPSPSLLPGGPGGPVAARVRCSRRRSGRGAPRREAGRCACASRSRSWRGAGARTRPRPAGPPPRSPASGPDRLHVGRAFGARGVRLRGVGRVVTRRRLLTHSELRNLRGTGGTTASTLAPAR